MTLAADAPLLLHNPRCSKSRAAKALLDERGLAYRERLYLEDPLSRAELAELQRLLDRPPREWTRTKEDAYAAAGLTAGASDAAHLDALEAHPGLLERPILVVDGRAAVGRPTEALLELLD